MWLLLSLACSPSVVDSSLSATETDAVVVESVETTLSDGVSTVATLAFTTSAAIEVVVRHGRWSTTSSGTEHEVLLLGLPAATETSYVIEGDGEVLYEGTVTTGALPAALPRLTMSGDAEAAPSFMLVPIVGATNAVLVVDAVGRVVWYHEVESGRALMRAFPTPDGSGVVLLLAMGGDDDTTGAVRWLDWHGELLREVAFPGLRMDGVVLADGTIAGVTAVTDPDYAAYGDALVELSPDGGFTEIWNSWGAMDPERDEVADIEAGLDWTHVSAVEYDPNEAQYYLTLGHLSGVTKIDRASGEMAWTLFGEHNEWEVDGEEMLGMHQIDLTDAGMLVFNNGHGDRGYSRAVEYAIDEEARTATEIWEHIPDPALWVYIKGDAHRLDSGDTLIIWSSSGQAQIVSEDNVVRWQLGVELGYVMLFSEVLGTLGPE